MAAEARLRGTPSVGAVRAFGLGLALGVLSLLLGFGIGFSTFVVVLLFGSFGIGYVATRGSAQPATGLLLNAILHGVGATLPAILLLCAFGSPYPIPPFVFFLFLGALVVLAIVFLLGGAAGSRPPSR